MANVKKTKPYSYKKDCIFLVLFLTPLVAACAWSFEPSLRSIWAAYNLKETEIFDSSLVDYESVKELKRSIQMHFLGYDVYIPLEDIVTTDKSTSNKMFTGLMKEACGSANLYIWLPLPIRVPVIQSKTFELCWKPKLAYK